MYQSRWLSVCKITQVEKVSYPTKLKYSSAFQMGYEYAHLRYIWNLFQKVLLVNGTEAYERWRKLPIPLSFNVYVFNVTNPDDVQNGSNPVVQEIGPYVYEWVDQQLLIESLKKSGCYICRLLWPWKICSLVLQSAFLCTSQDTKAWKVEYFPARSDW
jgi:hypothetical protein